MPEAAATEPQPAATSRDGPPKRLWDAWMKLDQGKKSRALFVGAGLSATLFLVILIVHIAVTTTSATTPRQVVIAFTDGRADDLLALNYLAHRSDVFVPYVVTAANGPGSAYATHRNVRGFYSLVASSPARPRVPTVLIGAPFATADTATHNCTYRRAVDPEERQRVDSAYGASRLFRAPLRTQAADLFAAAHAALAAGDDERRAAPGQPEYFLPAVRSFLERQADGSVTLLAMGPLTDVNALLRATGSSGAELRRKVQRVVVSGGTISAFGDLGPYYATNTRAEMNLFLDPAAANAVLARGADDPDVTVVPADAVAAVPYSKSWAKLTHAAAGNPVDSALGRMLSGYYASVRPQSHFDEVGVPRDLAAAAMATSPRTRAGSRGVVGHVAVSGVGSANLDGVGVLGATAPTTAPVTVVSSLDAEAFWPEYHSMTAAPWPR